MSEPDRGPKDYADQDPDDWDPSGYYARKTKHREEMLPYIGGLFVASVVIVFLRILYQENIMILTVIVGVACLFIGWNVPQPKFARKGENWIRVKLGLQPKSIPE